MHIVQLGMGAVFCFFFGPENGSQSRRVDRCWGHRSGPMDNGLLCCGSCEGGALPVNMAISGRRETHDKHRNYNLQ